MNESLRLFLIEDNDDTALLIRKALERAGHRVTRCRCAADALIVLSDGVFDLVILDQFLPDMTGVAFLQALRHEGLSVPVLMVTAYGDEQLAARVLKEGALDYLVKDDALDFLVELPKRVVEGVIRHRLQHMNLLLIEALESARDGILITDLGGTVLHLNHALERLTGYPRQELLLRPVRQIDCVVHPPDLWDRLCPTLLARSSWQGEMTLKRPDATHIDMSLAVSPIVTPQGQLTHFVAILRDVTERNNLQRQLLQAQKMQSVGTLAGGVAHEFNNLLAGISGYAALALREPDLPAQARDFLSNILGLAERAAGLTRQLLAFARKPALTRRPLAMPELVRGTADLVRRTLHLEVLLDIQEPLADEPDPGAFVVHADVNQLQQALVNLALNARDAMRERLEPQSTGTPHSTLPPITFRLRHAVFTGDWPAFPQNVPPGDYVVLEVIDQGCGMPANVLNQALDPFYTTKDVGQGTGLGLPMVFGIIQGHQGYMTIDSTPGEGTCIGLYLPRLTTWSPGTPAAGSGEWGHVLEPEALPGHSILVIDDEEAVQDVIRRFLEIAGMKVTCVASGAAALDVLQNGAPYDLVILDVMMPREDAAVTFSRIRQRRPHLPVLLCTGLPQDDPVPQILQAGAAGLLRKPFRMNELAYAVKQAMADAPAEPRG